MNKPQYVIVHCSDSEFGDAALIREWHLARGWKDIGYHLVILNGRRAAHRPVNPGCDGLIELGRPAAEIGSHCLGYNDRSIGLCLIGKNVFTDAQRKSLIEEVRALMAEHTIPVANVLGHCETESGKAEGKTCPNMDMDWLRGAVTGV